MSIRTRRAGGTADRLQSPSQGRSDYKPGHRSMCYPSKGQSTFRFLVRLPLRRSRPVAHTLTGSQLGSVPATLIVSHLVSNALYFLAWTRSLFTKTYPLRSSRRLLICVNPSRLDSITADSLLDVVAVLSARLSPAFVGSDLFTTTGSTAASHHIRRRSIDSCCDVTSFSRFAYGRANAAWMVSGFPSYCAGSLLVDHVSNLLVAVVSVSSFAPSCMLTPAAS